MSETKAIKVDDDFQSAFDGLMLGDGCVTLDGKRYKYVQACKHRDWLESLKLWFLEHGFSSSLYTRNNHITTFCPNGTTYHQLRVKAYTNYFKEQRKRWYSWSDSDGWEYNRIQKVVPEDIVLTSQCVANWLMGDGSYLNNSKRAIFTTGFLRIKFATNGFLEPDVDLLCNLIKYYIGVNAHKKPSSVGSEIYITGKSNAEALVDYVKPHIHPLYRYKIGE